MKKLAVIGCGVAAYPILKKARELGIQTVCFSQQVNPSVEGLYDYHLNVDYYDVVSIVKHCKEIGVNGVIATGENTTSSTAYVAKQLGLPGNNVDHTFICNNKLEERKALADSLYVRQPKYFTYDGHYPKYPVIVKAVDASGKKGISIARNDEEFDKAILYSKEASKNDIILVEEYLEGGIEYSVECISSKGVHQIIQVTKKDVSGPPHFAELGHHEPGDLSISFEEFEKSIFEILNKTGILNSLSHIEVKIIDRQVYFIELGARGGGDRISDTLVYLSTDYDYYKAAIQVSLGEYKPIPSHSTHYSGIYYYCAQTKFLKPLFEYAKSCDWCKEIKLPNELVEKNGNDDGNTSGYLIYQSDHKVSLRDVPFVVDRINNYPNALSLLCDFTIASKRKISYSDMLVGMKKFIDKGNVIGCLFDDVLYGMLNIYCNDLTSRDAYINNVEVLMCYRGLGLSKKLLKAAYDFILARDFKSVSLDVASSNLVAINLYVEEGFVMTGNTKRIDNDVLLEMRKQLV